MIFERNKSLSAGGGLGWYIKKAHFPSGFWSWADHLLPEHLANTQRDDAMGLPYISLLESLTAQKAHKVLRKQNSHFG